MGLQTQRSRIAMDAHQGPVVAAFQLRKGVTIMIIGTFTQAAGKLSGTLSAYLGSAKVSFQPNEKGPDFTLIDATGSELGIAWRRTSKAGKEYISVKLDSPTWPSPINAALFADKNGRSRLVWDRDDRKSTDHEE
jgi:uncharacterized protein (DUF736 family)